ncbi:hypothetical protein [Desulforegula conservatrix]|uniref:hypothetical protein n=1 Tax=Desulforegula conservatrix TaxID=153026 RepID=UPI0003FB7DDF|nr:hypothetical protein [Desulforegula conservatrix]
MDSDGCTCFFDGNWWACCVGHDYEYADGGTLTDKIVSDWKLAKCVANRGGTVNKVAAALMFVGVSVGGYTRYRFK